MYSILLRQPCWRTGTCFNGMLLTLFLNGKQITRVMELQSALCSQSHHFELSIFTRYANLISMVYSDIDPPNVAEVSNLKTEHSKCAFRYNYMYSQNLDRWRQPQKFILFLKCKKFGFAALLIYFWYFYSDTNAPVLHIWKMEVMFDVCEWQRWKF